MLERFGAYLERARTSDFANKVGETFFVRVLVLGIGMATSIWTARLLGVEGRGLFSVAMTVGVIGVQFGNLGLHSSNVYFLSKNPALLPSLTSNALIVSLAGGGAAAVIARLVFAAVPRWAPVGSPLLDLALLWAPIGLAFLLLQNMFLGVQKVRDFNIAEIMNRVLVVGLILALILSGRVSATAVFTAYLCAGAVTTGWMLLRLRRDGPLLAAPSMTLFHDNLRYGLKVYLGSLFAYITIKIDIVMVNHMLGAEAAGHYSVASALADIVLILPSTVASILFPKLSAIPDFRTKWRLSKRAALVTGAAMLPVCFLSAWLSRPIIGLLFGPDFLPASPAFVWLVPGLLFMSVATVVGTVLGASGMPKYAVLPAFATAVLNVILNVWTIRAYGIAGAALASTVTYGLLLVLVLAVIKFVHLPRMRAAGEW